MDTRAARPRDERRTTDRSTVAERTTTEVGDAHGARRRDGRRAVVLRRGGVSGASSVRPPGRTRKSGRDWFRGVGGSHRAASLSTTWVRRVRALGLTAAGSCIPDETPESLVYVPDSTGTLTHSPLGRNTPVRVILTIGVCCLAFGLAATAAAAAGPGWTVAKAEKHLVVNLTLVHPDVVAAAKKALARAKLIGGPAGIAEAEATLRAAKAGFSVDKADCVGVRPAAGGFVAFRCKLRMSDALGLRATARGTWSRNAETARWKWRSSSFVVSTG